MTVGTGRGPITLGGRTFASPERSTFAQHAYVMDLVYRAELDQPGEDLAAFIARVFRSGCVPALLAGLLVECGTNGVAKWSAPAAAANTEFFADLDDPAEFVPLGTIIAEELLGFFLRAPRLSARSRSSSAALSTTAPSGAIAAPSIAATGTSSSASSPATTLSASSRS